METKIIEIDSCEREMEISATRNEILPYLENAYLKAQPKLEIKGFRKGKVPVSVIKQRFGREIEAETLEEIANEMFQKAVVNNKMKFVGQPFLKDIQKEENGYKFFIAYEVVPEFELSDYRGLNIDEPVHRVTSKEIEHEIEHICINYGTFNPAEEVLGDLYVVGLTLREVDKFSGFPLIGVKPQETQVFLHNHNIDPNLKQNLMNKIIGDSFTLMLDVPEQETQDKLFNITVNAITEVVPKEFNDDFVKEFTKGKFESIEDFKQEISFQIQENWDQKSRQEMENQITDKLVQDNQFDVPKFVVYQVMQALFEDVKKRYENVPAAKELKFEDMESDLLPVAEHRVRWEIIRNKIIEKENLVVEDFDIEHLVEYEANRSKSDKNAVRKQLMENKNVTENILTKKFYDLILDFAITNEVPFQSETLHEHGDDEDDDYDDEHDYDDVDEHSHHHEEEK